MTTTVTVAGSTGSIGTQTLDVIATAPERYRVHALTAGSSWQAVAEQASKIRPAVVVLADSTYLAELASALPPGIEVAAGEAALREVVAATDVTINGIVGFAGLPATLGCLEAGKRLGLANKESLIAAGPVVQRARRTEGAELVPVDSEHAAIHQCVRANRDPSQIARLQVTASGGPFRGRAASEMSEVTVADALAHPTWSMGPKITVDSATLMNKGLEVIEAIELFGARSGLGTDLTFDDIDVVVHPQSVVHSMVTFTDGSTIAQLSNPDMRSPIGYALAYPGRLDAPFGRLDWSQDLTLTFEPPDRDAFPCLDLAFAAGRIGGTAPAWLSAANEVAVQAFL
ncbi:MAG: 1-deoxy-D-xylulose-5-phosphate reductoisomerase, partial [Acidimicrobiales bacterium]|nr:1-deoxy-D-xylulose-5-phosphate reductoisomerase [Acidimicrobiales bacterium]